MQVDVFSRKSVIAEDLLDAPYREALERSKARWLAMSSEERDFISRQRGCGSSETLRLSPDGQLIAVGLGIQKFIVVIERGGTKVRAIEAGDFRGWAGNEAVLATPKEDCPTCIYWYPVEGGVDDRELEQGFKRPVVSDPDGSWFAYPSEVEVQRGGITVFEGGSSLLIWDPMARLIASVDLGFTVGALAASSSDGLVGVPTWSNE